MVASEAGVSHAISRYREKTKERGSKRDETGSKGTDSTPVGCLSIVCEGSSLASNQERIGESRCVDDGHRLWDYR